MKYDIKPRDKYLFRRDQKTFVKNSKTSTLAEYVVSHTKAIHNSVKQWKEEKKNGVQSIYKWITTGKDGRKNKTLIERLHKRDRDRMLDGRQKERRRKHQRRHDQSTLPSVKGYFSLTRTH